MTRTITRAGLILGFVLVSCLRAGSEETKASDELGWDIRKAREALLAGRIDEVRSAREAIHAVHSGAESCNGYASLSLDIAVVWQNLEMEVPGFDGSMKWFQGGGDIGDLDYLEARVNPSSDGFLTVLKTTPMHYSTRRALATMSADEGKWEEARKAFDALVAERPTDPDTRHRYAFALYDHGDLDGALTQWAAALEADPHHADSWYGCGIAWLGRGIFESAEKALRKAVDLNPIHWRAREAMIQALVGQGKLAEAKPMREILRARAPQLPKVGDRIKVALLPREGGAVIVREAILPSVPWLFRIEWFGQAAPGGKPIKVMELRRDGEAFAWGEVDGDGKFRSVKPLKALPELEQVLEEAK